MRPMTIRRLHSALACAALAAAGCTGGTPQGEVPFNPQATTGDIHVRQNQQFEDIPVPYGFRLRRDRLFSYQGRMFRYGTFVYEGLWRGPETRNFYREQMPVHGWKFVDVRPTASRDGDMAVFTRDQESAEITVRELPSFIRVEVNVRNNRYTDPLVLARANRALAENPPAIVEESEYADAPVVGPGAGVVSGSPVVAAPGYTPGYTSGYSPGYASGTAAGYTPPSVVRTTPYPIEGASGAVVGPTGPGGSTPLRSGSPVYTNSDPLLPSGLGIQMQ